MGGDVSDYLQDVEWSLPQAVLVFVGGIVGGVLAYVGVVAVVGSETGPVVFAVSFAGQAGGNLLVFWILSTRRGTESFSTDFGLSIHLSHWWGIPAGFGLQIAVVVVTAPLLKVLFPDGPPQQEVASIAEESTSLLERLLIMLALVIVAPVVEEMLFRGMVLSRLVRSMPVTWAILVQGVVFAGVHLADPGAVAALPGLAIIGVVLGYGAIRTGSLSLPIMLHAGVNLTAAIALMFESELNEWLEQVPEPAGVEALISLFT